jgi:hypothetical protein
MPQEADAQVAREFSDIKNISDVAQLQRIDPVRHRRLMQLVGIAQQAVHCKQEIFSSDTIRFQI